MVKEYVPPPETTNGIGEVITMIVLILIAALAAGYLIHLSNQPPKYVYVSANLPAGVECQQMNERTGGTYELAKCSDNQTYYAVTNIVRKERIWTQ